MAQSCPNCGISCVGCAGAKLTTASDGKMCCTKCVATYNATKRSGSPIPGYVSPPRGPFTPHT